VVLLLRLFHIPSRFHPIHPSRRDSRESPRERENGESKEEGTDATSKRRNAWKRDVLEREEKKRGEKDGEKEEKRWKMCTRFLQVGSTMGSLEFPFRKTLLLLFSFQ